MTVRPAPLLTVLVGLAAGYALASPTPPPSNPNTLERYPARFPAAQSCLLGDRSCDALANTPASACKISTRRCATGAHLQPARPANRPDR